MYDFIKDAYAKLGRSFYLGALISAGEMMRGMSVTDEKDGEFLDVPGTYASVIAKYVPSVKVRVNGSKRWVFAKGSGAAIRIALNAAIAYEKARWVDALLSTETATGRAMRLDLYPDIECEVMPTPGQA
jgi:ribosomal protein L2